MFSLVNLSSHISYVSKLLTEFDPEEMQKVL